MPGGQNHDDDNDLNDDDNDLNDDDKDFNDDGNAWGRNKNDVRHEIF